MDPTPKQFFSAGNKNWTSFNANDEMPLEYAANNYQKKNVGGLEIIKNQIQEELKQSTQEVANEWNDKLDQQLLADVKQQASQNKFASEAFNDLNLADAGYKGIDTNGKEVKAKDTLFQSNFQPDYSWLDKQLNQTLENQPAPAAPVAPVA